MMTLCRVTFRANEARMCWILSSTARMSLGFALHKLTFRGFSQKHPCMVLMLPSSQSTTGWLLLEQGDLAGRRYCFETSICPSPVCQCERVTLRCSPELSPQSSVPVCLEMDLEKCEIANLEKLKSDPASITVAKAIANEIGKADWNRLWGFYLGAKRYLSEHTDPDQIDAHFPPDVLTGDGSMVGYYEILPYAKPVEFTLGAQTWLLDDQHCVRANCSCQEAALSFFELRDTYVEEYHRKFFTNYARGVDPRKCGGTDIHIGGLAHVGVLCAFFCGKPNIGREAVREHINLTHRAPEILNAADAMTRIISAVLGGSGLRETIFEYGSDWFSKRKAEQWSREPDEVVIGHRVSPACYIADAFPASLYLAWKYADDFEAGVITNANLGGDNCHRGAGISDWRWHLQFETIY